jgi:hypothetical protein
MAEHKPTCPNFTQQELDHKKFIDDIGFVIGSPEEQDQALYDALWPLFGAKEEQK